MLSPAHRLCDADAFRLATRRGRRAGSRTVVLHLLTGGTAQGVAEPVRVGFVVSKAVGNAVLRNRTKRRLRHLVRERLSLLPSGGVLVVRALPAAGQASSPELRHDLDRCLKGVGT